MRLEVIVQACGFVSAHDGDTFKCIADVKTLMPDVAVWQPTVRVVRINAPEVKQPGADEARIALVEWLGEGQFELMCYGRDKYGRLLGDGRRDGRLLSDAMLARGTPKMSTPELRALVSPV